VLPRSRNRMTFATSRARGLGQLEHLISIIRGIVAAHTTSNAADAVKHSAAICEHVASAGADLLGIEAGSANYSVQRRTVKRPEQFTAHGNVVVDAFEFGRNGVIKLGICGQEAPDEMQARNRVGLVGRGVKGCRTAAIPVVVELLASRERAEWD